MQSLLRSNGQDVETSPRDAHHRIATGVAVSLLALYFNVFIGLGYSSCSVLALKRPKQIHHLPRLRTSLPCLNRPGTAGLVRLVVVLLILGSVGWSFTRPIEREAICGPGIP